MERVWRRMNQGLSSKSKSTATTVRVNNTFSSAPIGDVQNVSTVPSLDTVFALGISTPTGRRLAASGEPALSQRVANTASSERRRRRRKCRPRRSRERSTNRNQNNVSSAKIQDNPGQSADTKQDEREAIANASHSSLLKLPQQSVVPPSISNDASLKDRAVAKLRLFNFHINWDLHITQCKPCRPRSSGNILTRRLCRNRRREDNELYRSNSFKFERFDRKDGNENAEMLRKQISVCDDYSLPIDFVKKRPSSFDPSLADKFTGKWSVPSPLSEHVSFLEPSVTITRPSQSVKLVEGYSDPKDSRNVQKYHRKKICRDKRVHYSSNSSVPNSSTDDDTTSNKFPELNSPDSISEDLLRPLKSHKSPRKNLTLDACKRNPSPYYYSDLLKSKEVKKEDISVTRQSITLDPLQSTADSASILQCINSCSLHIPEIDHDVLTPKRYSITEGGVRIIRCDSPSTTTSEDSNCSECEKRREWHINALALVTESCPAADTFEDTAVLSEADTGQYHKDIPMPPHRLLGPAVCACTAPAIGEDFDELFRPRSIFYVHQQGVHECVDCAVNRASDKSINTDTREEDMSSGKTRQIYETAFDSKISRSDDDLDDVDRLTSHSAMMKLSNGNPSEKLSKPRIEVRKNKNSRSQMKQNTLSLITTLSQHLEDTHIDENLTKIHQINSSASSQATTRKYTQSPPSTAPLPIKFSGKHDQDRVLMNSIRSAPNLPASNISKSGFSDLSLPMNSIRQQNAVSTESDGDRVGTSYDAVPRSRSRPRSIVLESGRVVELRSSHRSRQRRGQNYSSTESMATSSSGGSMESLKSSTSEGNRSTTSSESRQSTSLSSHSSDSGNISLPLRVPVALHSKLHILSPISDKSSQEPASETSEINQIKACNSQNNSPTNVTQEIISTATSRPNELQVDPILKQQKRKTFANKTLLHLADEIIGSDSGISLHSREERKLTQTAFRKFALPTLNVPTATSNTQLTIGLPQDLHDLPFEMPKLRRRKLLLQQENCTSGSATSVDLGDLPFDMPKLRRRLRMNQGIVSKLVVQSTESSGISQASSSHSVRDDQKHVESGATMFRPNLTLNLNEAKPANKFGSLDLKGSSRGLNLNIGNTAFFTAADLIDITVPLERQGWYHGSITRVEAENTLRPLTEGTFLVRNCESTKQDYSLSLKSAKGFMHMRIQRNESGQYILGQFSRPFQSVPEMIRHFCLNRLPVRGAEHMCLLDPVIAQLL